jgi:hypothetical protein
MEKDLSDRISIGWVIVRICILIVLIIQFNFFPERIGVIVSATAPTSFVPLLAPEFHANMPWLNFWWGLALILELTHLCLRRWQPWTRWADLALSVLVALVLLQIILQGAILVCPERAAAVWNELTTLPPRWQQSGVDILDLLIRGGLTLAILAIGVGATRKLPLCMASQQKPLPAQ